MALSSEEQRSDYTVVVVGHGPTGAIAASLLGDKGIRTLAIDRQRDVYDKPRAIAIDHEILRLLDNLGAAERIRPYVAPFPASQHFGAKGFVEYRPSWTFIHEAIGRDGDDQHVAKFACGFKMPDVSKMQQIKCAVSLHNNERTSAKIAGFGRELGHR